MNIKRYIYLLVFYLYGSSAIYGQRTDIVPVMTQPISLFAELGGQTQFGAVYVDYLLPTPQLKIHQSVSIGLIVRPLPNYYDATGFIIPIQYNLLFGKSDDYFELGFGFNALHLPTITYPLWWGGTNTVQAHGN